MNIEIIVLAGIGTFVTFRALHDLIVNDLEFKYPFYDPEMRVSYMKANIVRIMNIQA